MDTEHVEDDVDMDDTATPEGRQVEKPSVQELLWEAAKEGNEEDIAKLVKSGADVNEPDPSFGGWTAMHYAAQNGRWRAIATMVRLGAVVMAPPWHRHEAKD